MWEDETQEKPEHHGGAVWGILFLVLLLIVGLAIWWWWTTSRSIGQSAVTREPFAHASTVCSQPTDPTRDQPMMMNTDHHPRETGQTDDHALDQGRPNMRDVSKIRDIRDRRHVYGRTFDERQRRSQRTRPPHVGPALPGPGCARPSPSLLSSASSARPGSRGEYVMRDNDARHTAADDGQRNKSIARKLGGVLPQDVPKDPSSALSKEVLALKARARIPTNSELRKARHIRQEQYFNIVPPNTKKLGAVDCRRPLPKPEMPYVPFDQPVS